MTDETPSPNQAKKIEESTNQGTEDQKSTSTEKSPTPQTEKKPQSNVLPIAFSIIAAGGLIAAAIFFSNVYASRNNNAQPLGTATQNTEQQEGQKQAAAAKNTDPVTDADHMRGSRSAKVILVEYSDLDCPYCQQAHETLKNILAQYQEDEVAWVYRHFPLITLHPSADVKAQAAECVAELAGNEAFWRFTDAYFPVQDPRQGVELAITTATTLGVNEAQMQACVESGRYEDKVEAQFDDAVEAGGRGTPYTVLISGDKFVPIEGARPITSFTQVIDQLLED